MTKEDFLSVIESYKESARKMADLYLEKFPRKLCCEVNVGPSVLSLASFLLEFDDEEIAILRECMKSVDTDSLHRSDATTLETVLKQKGYTDLLNRLRKPFDTDEKKEEIEQLCKCFSCEQTPHIAFVNVCDPKKYATFGYFEYRGDIAPRNEQLIEMPLTDEEFRDILAKCLYTANKYTMNELIVDMPLFSQRLMRMAMAETYFFLNDNACPFILDITEIKSIAARILDPFVDCLGLFGSDDEAIKALLAENQLIGGEPSEYDYELVDENDGSQLLIMTAKFIGTDVEFAESYDEDCERFKVSAFELMNKFGLNEPKDIFPYIRWCRNWKEGLRKFRNDLIEQ